MGAQANFEPVPILASRWISFLNSTIHFTSQLSIRLDPLAEVVQDHYDNSCSPEGHFAKLFVRIRPTTHQSSHHPGVPEQWTSSMPAQRIHRCWTAANEQLDSQPLGGRACSATGTMEQAIRSSLPHKEDGTSSTAVGQGRAHVCRINKTAPTVTYV